MKTIALIALLLALAGCNSCFSDACWAQKNYAYIHKDDYLHTPTPAYVAFSSTEIACPQAYGLETRWLASLTILKDREHDLAAYREQKRRLISQHHCRMFKAGTKIASHGGDSLYSDIEGNHVYFRLPGSPTRYVTFKDALTNEKKTD